MIEMNNSTKSNKSDDKKQTKPQQDKQNGSVNTEKKEQTNEKPSQQEQPKETKPQTKSNGVCVVDYIGNGVWIDSENQKWANKDVPGTNIKCQRKYSVDEYDKRDDIKFMVSYGEMRLTTGE